ncbi:MAG: S8 family peptidase [Candidatus Woesearchaeota archaeon]
MVPQNFAASANDLRFTKKQIDKLHPSLQKRFSANPDETITVLVQKKEGGFIKSLFGGSAKKDIEKKISKKVNRETNNYVAVEISIDDLIGLTESGSVGAIYIDHEYSVLLDESVPAMNADTAWNLGYDGTGIKVAVLDTGIDYTNDAFQDRVILSEVFTGEDHSIDMHGHGTHVAGIVAGNGNYVGVAPDANLMNAKVLYDDGSGTSSSIIAGIEWAVANGADVISLSVGSPIGEQDDPVNLALQNAINSGIVVVVASGNYGPCSGKSFEGVASPGNYEEVISVGAVDESGSWACFSSGEDFGDYIKPDIVAPGVGIISYYKDGLYKSMSGTSMSTPHIAGVAALLLEEDSTLNHYSVKNLLESNAVDLGESGKDIKFGSGFVDIGILFGGTSDNETQEDPINETSDENDTIESYDGFYVTVPINLSNIDNSFVDQNEASTQEVVSDLGIPSEVKIKMRDSAVSVVSDGPSPVETNEYEVLGEISGSGVIDYDDDYTYSTGGSDDGVVWGGSYLDVGLDSEESSTMVICWDWCDDGTWDHCYADTLSDLQDCWSQSSVLYNICSTPDSCWYGDMDYDHEIDTGSSGDRWKCQVDARYYLNCGGSSYDWSEVNNEPYYVISPRQYKCTDQTSGGTYRDAGHFESTIVYLFETGMSCGGDWVCDEGKDDSKASFGSSGTSTPDEPCSLPDEKGDCDSDSDCFSGSHCSCVGTCSWDPATDYCCPDGEDWLGSSCGVNYECTSDSDCESYEKCSSSNTCVDKTCDDYSGTVASCNLATYLLGNTYCSPSEPDGDPVKCMAYGNNYCYGYIDTCTSTEYCDDPVIGGSQCFTYPCTITSSYWDKSQALEGEQVKLTITGQYCSNSDTARIKILEVDEIFSSVQEENYTQQDWFDWLPGNDDGVADLGEKYFSNNKIEVNWNAVYVTDYDSPWDIYRIAAENDHSKIYQGDLIIKKCFSDSDCSDGSWTGSTSCSNGNVYQDFQYGDCASGSCGYDVQSTLKETCTDGCTSGVCDTPILIDLVSYELSPTFPVLEKGGTFTLKYNIKNDGSTSVKVGLGATIRDSSNKEYYDTVNDKIITASSGTNEYSRTFKIPTDAIFGTYDVIWGIHNVNAANEFDGAIEITSYTTEIVNVVGCDDGICNNGETYSSCPADCVLVCEYPYGTSAECSCYDFGCNSGDTCSSVGHGTCIEEEQQQCDRLPDGSSEWCQCSSDPDCTVYDPDTYCSFTQDYSRCLPIDYVDQCSTIDELRCIDNSLYRCEQQEKFKDWMFVEGCSLGEICSNDVGDCVMLGDYDLVIDNAPSGLIVNKQPDTILEINVKVNGVLAPGTILEYDSANFDLIEGDACAANNFAQGDNKCYFLVDSLKGKSYVFKFGDDAQRVNTVGNDVHIAYLTDEKQIRRRYNDDNAVDLMFAKLYEESAANNGVVHNLDVQFEYLNEYDAAHPFDKDFKYYSEDRLFPKMMENEYSDQVSLFVQDHLSYARNVVVVGDDYVVPHRRDIYSIRAGSLPAWLRPWYNSLKSDAKYLNWVTKGLALFSIDVGEYMPDDLVVKTMYTDQNLVQRQVEYTYSNLDEIFRIDEAARGNEVKIILPTSVSADMRTAIENLKSQLISEMLVEKMEHFEELQGSTMNCNDFQTFDDAWLFDPLDLPIIIGTIDTNPALNCYPIYSAGSEFEDVISLEPSVWNGNGASIVMNTDNPDVVNSFANYIIANDNWKDLHGRGYMYFHDTVTAVSLLLIPVSFGASAWGGAAARGIVLAVDITVSAVDAYDQCYYREGQLPDSGMKWVGCAASAAPIISWGAGKIVSNMRLGKLMKVAGEVAENADEAAEFQRAASKFIRSSETAADALKKIPSDKYGDFAIMLSREMASESVDEFGSQFAKSLSEVITKSNLKRSAFKNGDELIDLIGKTVKKHADEGDEVLEAIAKIISKNSDESTSILKLIKGSDEVWSKSELEKLNEFNGDTLRSVAERMDRTTAKWSPELTLRYSFYNQKGFFDGIDDLSVNNFVFENFDGIDIPNPKIGKVDSNLGSHYFRPDYRTIPGELDPTGYKWGNRMDKINNRVMQNVYEGDNLMKLPNSKMQGGILISTIDDTYTTTGVLIEDVGGASFKEFAYVLNGDVYPDASYYTDLLKNTGDVSVNIKGTTITLTDSMKTRIKQTTFGDFIVGEMDSHPGNFLVHGNNKVSRIDMTASFGLKQDKVFVSVKPDIDNLFKYWENEQEIRPHILALADIWRKDDAGKKEVLELLKPEVDKWRLITKEQFEATTMFEELTKAERDQMQIITNKLFKDDGFASAFDGVKKGRMQRLIDDFDKNYGIYGG